MHNSRISIDFYVFGFIGFLVTAFALIRSKFNNQFYPQTTQMEADEFGGTGGERYEKHRNNKKY